MESFASHDEFNLIFSNGEIDLTKLSPSQLTGIKEINIIFSRGVIRVNPDIPVKIQIDSAFSGVRLPDGSSLVFGDYTYQTESYQEVQNLLKLKVDVVFGSLEVVE